MANGVYLGKLMYIVMSSGWERKLSTGKVVKIQKDGFMIVFSNDKDRKEHYYRFDSVNRSVYTTEDAAKKSLSSIW